MKRMMGHRMMHHWMHPMCFGPGPHGPFGWGPRCRDFSKEDMVSFLEEYQRDLEQEAADVAEHIKRLKEAETTE